MTTVFRLPPEPPVGTTVRPEPDNGERYTRLDTQLLADGHWRFEMKLQHGMPGVAFVDWAKVLRRHPGGVVVVEPDPHPTPWTCATGIVYDANDKVVADFNFPTGESDSYQLARRVVLLINADAVNKAATP